MAPKVEVPCNFGRQYINSPDHSNLELKLKDTNKLLVNSMIMSCNNSPVIHNLTTNLHQSSLDVDEFSDEAVRCFVDCLYTGEIELLNINIFKDAYKMAHVFGVEWLVGMCTDFFSDLVSDTDVVKHDDEILLLFEEACYVSKTFKRHHLREAVGIRSYRFDRRR